ncbi:unnamed protein product [Phaedon cochleariae]|uniref:Copper transport protein n=1 Tax=Phaedon cochleariae TaxID=80249 RepID=A0A9P0GU18_PHACE|nr:unnamed protein product [Phaedon cochleariae]
MMHQAFWWGTQVDDLLFKGFSANSVGGLIGQCLFIGGMAFFFEYLRYLQTKQKQRELVLRVKQLKLLCPTESAALLAQTVTNPTNPLNITLFDRALLFGAEISLWLLLQNLGYFIMLAVMVYNAWFLVSAVLGGALGYFIFGQMFMKINIQNCQLMRSAYCTQICGETDVGSTGREGESTPITEDTPSTSQNDLKCNQKNGTQEVQIKVQCH